jgi:Tfp pilus assembly protein PilV
MNRRPFHPRGMVLLELMVALFVFTVVAFSLVMALDAAMTAGKERNDISTVVAGMNNQLTLLHSNTLIPCDRDVPPDGSGIVYHLTIQPEQFVDQKRQPVPNIYQATITAKWNSGGENEDRSLSELIYQP